MRKINQLSAARLALLLAPLLVSLVIGCDDSIPVGPAPVTTDPDDGDEVEDVVDGAILVSTVSEGRELDLDPDGYRLVLTKSWTDDSGPDGVSVVIDTLAQRLMGTDRTWLFDDLASGVYELELSSLASNCVVAGENPASLEVMEADTASAVFQVTCAAVSRPIAFVRSVGTGADAVAVTNLDGSSVRYLSDTGDQLSDSSPAWSPNGRRLVFRQFDGGDWDWRVNLWLMDADGSSRVELTADYADDPAWSPDGSRIAFVTGTGYYADQDVYVMKSDGSDWVRLTSAAGYDGEPSWSPDGAYIAFTSERDGNREIYVMEADGSNPLNLTRHPGLDQLAAWSPDGTQIAFTTDRDGQWEVYVMDADGSRPTRLTTGGGEDSEPAWAPDGSRIAYTCEEGGNLEICLMNADGTNPRNLTRHPADDHSPTWSPRLPTPPTEPLR